MSVARPAVRSVGVAVAIVLLSAGLLAGCGGGAHPSSPSKVMSGALAYANCMRTHGVPDFPDPNSQGEFQLHTRFENGHVTQGQDLVPSSPAFQAAERTCGSFGSAGRQVTQPQEQQAYQKELRAAACMRANGVPEYPDPKLIDGSIDLEFNGNSTRTHPRSSRRPRSAPSRACRLLGPSRGG